MAIVYLTTNSAANAGQGERWLSYAPWRKLNLLMQRASECVWMVPGTYDMNDWD